MASLLRSEPPKETATEHGFRVLPALGWATCAGLFAFGGLWLRFPAGSAGPIAGIDTVPIQVALSGLLACCMFLTTWFIRSRTVRHIRWAVITSLLVHLLLCIALRFLVVGMIPADLGESSEPAPLRELTLPDYGGFEIAQEETPEWERPAEIRLPENAQPELDRQQTAPEFEMAPDDIQPEPARVANIPERLETMIEPILENDPEIQRQVQAAEADAPEHLDSPEVAESQASETFQPEAAATDTARAEESLPDAHAESVARAERALPDMSSAEMERQSDVTLPEFPTADFSPQRNSRRPALPETQAESVQIQTSRSTNPLVDARATSTPRRDSSQLPTRRPDSRATTESRSAGFRPSPSNFSGRVARSVQPRMSNDSAAELSAGSRSAGSAAALAPADSSAEAQNVASAASGSASQFLSQPGPRSTSLNRSTAGRFSGQSGSGSTGSRTSSSARSRSTGSLAGSSSGTSGLSRGRMSGNAPSLAESRSNGGAMASGRRAADASLSSDALQAEQSGGLVLQGPQADGGGASGTDTESGLSLAGGGASGRSSGGRSTGGLSGPRTGSLSRRSAGLPGSGSRGRSGSPNGRRSLPGSGGRGTGKIASLSKPKLGSRESLSGLIGRRSTPTPGAAGAGKKISPGFSSRGAQAKSDALRERGGSDASEKAVERGLAWLAEHQFAAGNWSTHAFNCQGHNCGEHSIYNADSAATGLALLAFLGAGHTHRTGDYQKEVQRGLKWLTGHQKPDGDLYSGGSDFVWFYSHGMAAIALCEAYGMTKDPALKQPAQRAIDFIVKSQHPEFGGWRYRPQYESDTSVSGWQLMALKSGEMAGLQIPSKVYTGIRKWLDSAQKSRGQYAYHSSKTASPAMSAEALLMRQYLGADQNDPDLIAGANYLSRQLPRNSQRNIYYWYYATQVMFHLEGDHWNTWNAQFRDLLIDAQEKDGPVRGSWSTIRPTRDKWGEAGGRHYMTCINLLMLEVYYRHLPLYSAAP